MALATSADVEAIWNQLRSYMRVVGLLEDRLRDMPTKDDLKDLATKDDLKDVVQHLKDLATKDDLTKIMKNLPKNNTDWLFMAFLAFIFSLIISLFFKDFELKK